MSTPTVNYVVPVHQRKKDGTINAKIRVTFKGKSRWLPTTVYLTQSDLTRAGKLRNGTAAMQLEDLCRELRTIVAGLSVFALEKMDVDGVVSYIKTKRQSEGFALDFVQYGMEFAAGQSAAMGNETRKALAAWLRFRDGQPTDINDVTVPMILDFCEYVNNEPRLSYNRWTGEARPTGVAKRRDTAAPRYFAKLKAVFASARLRYNDDEVGEIRIPRDPFARCPAPRQAVPEGQRNLGVEVIQRLIDARPVRANQRYAIDMFLLYFCCMGTNLKDFYDAPPFLGKFEYERSKTKRSRRDRAFIRMTVPPEIDPAVERLRDRTGKRWLSLWQKGKDVAAAGTKINGALRTWAKHEGLEPFTLYAARHSWATIARSNAKVDKATVDECLNHVGDMDMADIYIEKDFDLLDEANRKVMDLFDWTGLA